MITKRNANDRGLTRIGWLDSKHTFSFGRYYDPEHMGFRALRVINDDIVMPGAGFGTHPHRDMEIITWVLDGTLAHKDSTGSTALLAAGGLQRMSAGTGLTHSEFNGSSKEPVHFLQVWLEPAQLGIPPRHDDLVLPPEQLSNQLRLVASPDGEAGSSVIAQDARVFVGRLQEGVSVDHSLPPGRYAWVQVARGSVTINGETYLAGDGAQVSGETLLTLQARGNAPGQTADLMLFDLA